MHRGSLIVRPHCDVWQRRILLSKDLLSLPRSVDTHTVTEAFATALATTMAEYKVPSHHGIDVRSHCTER